MPDLLGDAPSDNSYPDVGNFGHFPILANRTVGIFDIIFSFLIDPETPLLGDIRPGPRPPPMLCPCFTLTRNPLGSVPFSYELAPATMFLSLSISTNLFRVGRMALEIVPIRCKLCCISNAWFLFSVLSLLNFWTWFTNALGNDSFWYFRKVVLPPNY